MSDELHRPELHQFRVLTRKNEFSSHHQTEVTIDWTDVKPEDLMFLAKSALVYDMQARFAKSTEKVPSEWTIKASEMVKKPLELKKYSPKPHKDKATLDLETLLRTYSMEELLVLLK
jgi:hypothetical protein